MKQRRPLANRSTLPLSAGAPARLRRVLLTLMASLIPALASAQGPFLISGAVTDAASTAPLAGITVTGCTMRPFGPLCAEAVTDESGQYGIDGPFGSYYLFTSGDNSESGLVNEVHDNIACPGTCPAAAAFALGTPFEVAAAGASGKDFQLSLGGTLTGAVEDAATAAPLPLVVVSVYTRVADEAVLAGFATTDSAGGYSVVGLTTGTHFAQTSNAIGYTNEIYDDILCLGPCSWSTAVASGAEVPITLGATTANRNFRLKRGGVVTGIVRSNPTFAGIEGATVDVYARVGTAVTLAGSATAGPSGLYQVSGLPTGTYYALAKALFHISEVFGDVPCAVGCTPAVIGTGTPIDVIAGEGTLIDFALQEGSTIFGRISFQDVGLPLADVRVNACVIQGATTSCTPPDAAVSTASGFYAITGLPAGSYYIYTTNSALFVDEIHDNIACVGPCEGPANALASGAPVAVTIDTPAERDFQLAAGGLLDGILTNAATSKGVPSARVNLFGTSGQLLLSTVTNDFGAYAVSGLLPGSYLVATESTAGVINEVWNDVPCAATGGPCAAATITAGAPITVHEFGLSEANFALAPVEGPPSAPSNLGAVIAGAAVQFSWDAPAGGPGATGYVLEAGIAPGATGASFPVAETSLTVPGVPPGIFYARVRATNAFGMSPASNEFKFVVNPDGSGGLYPPTDVAAFTSGSHLTMTWAAPLVDGSLTGYVVEAGSATGRFDRGRVPVTTRSFAFESVPPGFYFLRVRSRRGSELSAPSAEVMINVGSVPAPPSAPEDLTHIISGSTVTFNWLPPALGTALGYVLEAGTEPGLANIATPVLGNGLTVSFTGVPPGTYYVRLRAFNALGASVASNERTVIVR